MKHLPFQSAYRERFEVVEQRLGRELRYPHNDQLPIVWRALDMEFKQGLPGRLARVDHRADGFHKVMRKLGALMYCNVTNAARADGVLMMGMPDEHCVEHLTVVQQITRETRQGLTHSFRFYGGEKFQPEVRLSGRRVVFADHVLQRFKSRVPNNEGEDLTVLLLALYGTPILSMPLGIGRALVVPVDGSLVAFPYKESREEFFLTTCLTMNELSILGMSLPPLAYNWHYGTEFTPPKVRHWMPSKLEKNLFEAWQRKTPLPLPQKPVAREEWPRIGAMLKRIVMKDNHGPGSEVMFLDGIAGPLLLEVRPGETPLLYDELANYKAAHPREDWDTIFAERDRFARGACLDDTLQP